MVNNGFSGTTTKALNESGSYQTSTIIYDGQLRPRQTQAATPQGGRLVNDTFYDTHGWTKVTYNGWWDAASTPTLTIAQAADLDSEVPNQTFNTFDGLGRVVVETNAKNGLAVSKTTTVYNGDRTTVVPPTGGVTAAATTDPLGRQNQRIEYTSAPTVVAPSNTFTGIFRTTGGTSISSTYTYDVRGNQNGYIDQAGGTWTTTYDLLGRAITRTDPTAGTTTSKYDANNNLIESTDALNATSSFTYDALNRKTAQYAASADQQSAANKLAEWVYDNSDNALPMSYANGQLTSSTSFASGAAYKKQYKNFNVFGSSLGETVTIPTATEGTFVGGSYDFSHTYTANLGLKLKDTFPAKGGLPSEAVLYGYGVLDLPDRIGSYAQSVTYDAYGRVFQEEVGAAPNTAYLTNTYDDHTSRLTEQRITQTRDAGPAAFIDKQTFEYDAIGNVLEQTSSRSGASTPQETQCFRYDALQRLTQAWTANDSCAATPTPTSRSMVGSGLPNAAYWTSWDIDLAGNRTKQTVYGSTAGNDVVTTYSYNGVGANQPSTLTSTSTTGAASGTTTYTYDAAGNMKTRNAGYGAQSLEWGPAGRLEEVSGGTAGTTSYIYDADGQILLQKDAGSTVLYLGAQQHTLNTTTQAVTGTRYFPLPGGGTAIRTGSGANYTFAFSDSHATPSFYLDSTTQNPTWRQYAPFGEDRGAAVAAPDNHGFLDKPVNKATGLVQVGARQYDVKTGRFISLDPVFAPDDPQSWNGYAYGNNNPNSFSDPTGLRPAEQSSEEYAEFQKKRDASRIKNVPTVRSPKLRSILEDDVYARPGVTNAKGDGKVGTAVIDELTTGRATGQQGKEKWHYEKAARAFNRLSDLLEADRAAKAKGLSPLLDPGDRATAMAEAGDLWKALNTDDTAGAWTRDVTATEKGRAQLEHIKATLSKAASRAGVAEITGATYTEKIYNGRPVGKPRLDSPPRLRGVAGSLSVVGEVGAFASGLQGAYSQCGWDCSAPDVANNLMCAMIPGCDSPESFINPYRQPPMTTA